MNARIPISPRVAAAALALWVCALLGGCATPLDRAWGVSQRAHVAQSTVNPDAGLNDLESRRQDGVTTDSALSRYRTKETQLETPEPPPVININTD